MQLEVFFKNMRLRHLCVVNDQFELLGILTFLSRKFVVLDGHIVYIYNDCMCSISAMCHANLEIKYVISIYTV